MSVAKCLRSSGMGILFMREDRMGPDGALYEVDTNFVCGQWNDWCRAKSRWEIHLFIIIMMDI